MKIEIFACPTCKSWKYLELYDVKNCYCRRCEEGCVKPIVIEVDEALLSRRTMDSSSAS